MYKICSYTEHIYCKSKTLMLSILLYGRGDNEIKSWQNKLCRVMITMWDIKYTPSLFIVSLCVFFTWTDHLLLDPNTHLTVSLLPQSCTWLNLKKPLVVYRLCTAARLSKQASKTISCIPNLPATKISLHLKGKKLNSSSAQVSLAATRCGIIQLCPHPIWLGLGFSGRGFQSNMIKDLDMGGVAWSNFTFL